MGWWLSIPVILLLPREVRMGDPVKQQSLMLKLFFGSAFVATLLWLCLSQWMYLHAQIIAQPEESCIIETDGTKSRWSLVISPRKMLFENSYKGTTTAYLRARDSSGTFNHHWSFRAMRFVPDETYAFASGFSYYRTDQTEDPC